MGKLADGFQERQALNVANRSTDFGDDHISAHLFSHVFDTCLDLVGDMRDDLHGAALVLARTLLIKHALIHLAAGEVVQLREICMREPLVMTKVEIGLRPVIEHINFTVLVGVHGARIDV